MPCSERIFYLILCLIHEAGASVMGACRPRGKLRAATRKSALYTKLAMSRPARHHAKIMTQFPDTRFIKSAHMPRDFPADAGREVAFAGRSNAGKSSAINSIVQRRALARTSKTPGRTQLINFFGLDEGRRLVDLPGYGFARVPLEVRNHWRELMQAYFSKRSSVAGVILVVDIRRGLGEIDRQMLDWAMGSACPVHILLTKSDKLKRSGVAQAIHATEQVLASEYADSAQASLSLQAYSSLKHTGVEDAREVLREWLEVPTSSA